MKLLNRFAYIYIYIYQSNLKHLLNSIVNKTCQSWQAFCVVERLVSR